MKRPTPNTAPIRATGLALFWLRLHSRFMTVDPQRPEPENQAEECYRAGYDGQDNQAKEECRRHANNSNNARNNPT